MNLFFMSNFLKVGVKFILAPIIFLSFGAMAETLNPDEFICIDKGNTDLKLCRNLQHGYNPLSIKNNELILASSSPLAKNNIGTTSTEIVNYVKLPDTSDFLTNSLAIIAILISVGIPAWQRFSEKSDANSQREDNINEGYWIREVIMPKINTSVFEICSEYKAICPDSPQDYSSNYRSKVLPKINELRDLFNLLTVFPKISQSAMQLNYICDSFDDDIADNENENKDKRKDGLNRFHIDITKELMLTHKNSL